MKKKKICGIYKITSPSEKIYIGSSKNMHRRHLEYKNLNCEYQFKLYNSLVKYGFENHIIEVIEECSIDELNCRERYWQDFYDVLSIKGLNLTLQDCGEKRKIFSKEAKRTIGERQKGGKNPSATKVINVNTLEEYDCMKCLAEELGINPRTLGSKLRSRVTNDTPFIYEKHYEDFLKGIYTNVNIFKERRKSHKVINIENKIIFNSIKEATKDYKDFKYRTVVEWLKNPKINRSPFRYVKDYNQDDFYKKDIRKRTYTNNKKIINISNLLVYKSLREASLVENINVNTLKGHISKYPHLTNCRYLENFLKDNPDFDTSLFTFYEK